MPRAIEKRARGDALGFGYSVKILYSWLESTTLLMQTLTYDEGALLWLADISPELAEPPLTCQYCSPNVFIILE